jgi:hypothetical protein
MPRRRPSIIHPIFHFFAFFFFTPINLLEELKQRKAKKNAIGAKKLKKVPMGQRNGQRKSEWRWRRCVPSPVKTSPVLWHSKGGGKMAK